MTDIPSPSVPLPKPKKPRCIRTDILMPGGDVVFVYSGKKILDAMAELLADMTLYHGVRYHQVLQAVYAQGRKDGARALFDKVDVLKGQIPHRNPGQPKKLKKPKGRKRK